MKAKATTIAYSLGLLFALTILFSLIFSTLYYNNVISTNTFHILSWIFGCISYLCAGFMLGKGINKKALLHAFIIGIILLFIGFMMMENHGIIHYIEIGSKFIVYLIGSVIAANIFDHS